MKQIFSITFLVIFSTILYGQNPPIDFDKNYRFSHFKGMIITKEDSIRGSFVIDTIYSCDYDSLHRIIALRKFEYSNNADGVTLYNYDINGKLFSQIFYEQTQRGNEIACSRISLTINTFNSFDSVSQSENYNCNKILNSKANEWNCSKTYSIKKNYNANKVLESSTMYTDNGIGFRLKYNYDILGRLIQSSFNQFEVGLSVYSWINYNDSIRVQIDTSTIWNQPVIKEITTKLNKNKQSVKEIEKWTQFENEEYSTIYNKGLITRYYEYDSKNRLIIIKEFYEEGKPPTIYRYNYKKKNGG